MWTITRRRFRRNRRGISNVIVVVLSLVIILAIVSNIILWNYEMNQYDWEKLKEDVSITNVERVTGSSWIGAQSEYALDTGIHVNGSYSDTQAVDGVFERFREASVLPYNPSDYSLSGSTSLISGSAADLTSDDGAYITLRSYSSGMDISDFVDDISNVDLSADKGTHSNFSSQQAGPDGIFDNLSEEEVVSGSGYRVQQGDFLFQGTDAYIPLTYTVDTTHAVVLMPNLMWQENVTASTGGDSSMNADDAFVAAYLYNSTHIRVQRWTSSDGDLRIGWQVLESFNDEFTVQRDELSLVSFSGQDVEATIASPVDPARSMAWHYWRTSYTGGDGRACQFYSNVTDNNTIAFHRQGTTSVTGFLRWIVIEWDLSKIDHFAQGYVTGFGSDTTPFLDSIGTTVNESQSLLIFQTHAIGDDGLDTSTTSGYLLNSTHVAFHNYDSNFSRGIKWYVIDFGSGVGSKQFDNYVSWASTDYVNDDVLNPAVQRNRTLVWLSGSCNGDGTAKPRHTQWWVLNSMNSTHSNSLHYERRYGGQNREIAWQVLELPRSTISNYELDLEVQWSNADYNETNEELAIYVSAESNTYSLDATGGYMVIGDGSPDWGSTSGTISFWIKWDTVDDRPWGQHTDMEARFSGSNLVLDWGGTGSLTSSTGFTTGMWYFIAITWDEASNDLTLYVGDEDNAPTVDASTGSWFSSVSSVGVAENNFMASRGGTTPTNGHGEDLRYYDTNRNLTEIQSDYNTELTGSETNLQSYFKLNNDFDDLGPDDNDGSGSGSYSFSSDIPFGGSPTENLQVDVWDGAAWQNVFAALTTGWNNVSVSSYLDSSTFTIRFKGDAETSDTTQDSWKIDATLLHVWSDAYIVEAEFTGSSDTEDWSQLTWLIDSAWTTGSVNVTLQLYNFTLDAYPTSGDGYMNYLSSGTVDTDETKSQTISVNPTDFRNATSHWKLKVRGVKATGTSFDFKADLIELSPENYRFDVNGAFVIDTSTYSLEDIQGVELQLRYRADDSAETWYLKAYNWTADAYSDNGFNSTAGHTPTTGWDYYAVNLTDVWQSYVHSNGTINIQFVDSGADSNQTTVDVDFLGASVKIDGTQITIENDGSFTVHLVSLWISNSTDHQRHDINVFVNSADTKNYLNTDVSLPTGSYTVKVVTERGNTAVYSGS